MPLGGAISTYEGAHMFTRNIAVLLGATLLLLAAAGCKQNLKVYVDQQNGERMRIAVLPFDNVSPNQEAGRVVTQTAITYLLSTGAFEVIEPGVVSAAMAETGVRVNDGISTDDCRKLQAKLSAQAFLVGMVEEFGDVRINADSYPSFSCSARLIDAETAKILWAATISKTGDDNVKIFDIGRVSSLGKLTKLAMGTMADSLATSKKTLLAGMGKYPTATPTQEPPKTTPGTTGPAKYLDEAPAYGEKELSGLLKDVEKFKAGVVTYTKHFHDTVETTYVIDGTNKGIQVKLVDYRTPATTEKFLVHYHPDDTATSFAGLKAFAGQTTDSPVHQTPPAFYYHLDLGAGRFGLFLRGPKEKQVEIEALATGLINALK
jgi:hypothetical protein